MVMFGPKKGLTTLEKCQFFDLLTSCFYSLERSFFGCKISSKTFSWPLLPKKKLWKNANFWTQPIV